jgi:hypothetical protein
MKGFTCLAHIGQRPNMSGTLASEAKGRGFDPRQPHHIFLPGISQLALNNNFKVSYAAQRRTAGVRCQPKSVRSSASIPVPNLRNDVEKLYKVGAGDS